LRQEFEEKPPATIAEAADRIERLTGVRRSPTHLFRGCCPLCPATFPPVTNTDSVNANTVATLLRQLAVSFSDLPIIVVLDNARYQHCHFIKNLAADLGIELLFLPSYSPNLNLIERLWKFVKKECLYSQYYDSFTNFTQAIQECLAEVSGKYKQQLASLLTLNFQTFENVTL
jgi:transposase